MNTEIKKLSTGASIHIDKRGAGEELVIFIHAVGGDHRSWLSQMEILSKKYFCVSLDLRGHGKSTYSSNGSKPDTYISMGNFAADIVVLINELGYHRAHLVGLSMGAVVALEVFKQCRAVVQSLTLANTWCYHPEAQARIEFMREQLSCMSLSESSAQLVPNLFGVDTPLDIIDSAVKIEGSKDPQVFMASWESMFKVDYRSMLPTIDVPVLLIGGTEDKVTPTEPLLTQMHSLIPMSRLLNLQGAGHFSNLDHPQEFTRALQVHLSRARREDSSLKLPAVPVKKAFQADTVAQALMGLLPRRGIDVFFSNSGTDFTPIIDALARYEGEPEFTLKTVVAPHENTAIAMAHGYFLLSGRPQAVMAHVNVGTANMGLGIINASRSRIPMLVLAGKTPWYESDVDGCRTNFVQWGQDTFDQGAYFREFTKWDYELKGAHNLDTIVDRALAISKTAPAGPVYLTLPKESLCAKVSDFHYYDPARQRAGNATESCFESIQAAAELISKAKNPLIITAELGRYPGGPEALVQLAQRHGIPVIEHGKRNFFNFPTDHPMHLGFSPSPHVEAADLIVSIESHVPWIPAQSNMKAVPRMIQIGIDPLCQNIPMRSFPVDLALAGNPVASLHRLTEALDLIEEGRESRAKRAKSISGLHAKIYSESQMAAQADENKKVITKRYLSYCIGKIVDDDAVIFNEYNLDPQLVPRNLSHSWFENSIASGLGWSLGAALGAQLAQPDQTMIVTLGDGTYLFNTPLSAHYVAAAYQLPILIVVFNDTGWSTIKKSYLGTTANGWAKKKDYFPLTSFEVPVQFEKLAESCGGIGLSVANPNDLLDILSSALKMVRKDKKHVLVNVICERDG